MPFPSGFSSGTWKQARMAAMMTPTGNEGQVHPKDQGRRHPRSTPHGAGLTTTQRVQASDTVPESPGAPETHDKAADSRKGGLLCSHGVVPHQSLLETPLLDSAHD